MWIDRAALISMLVLASASTGCSRRAGGQAADSARSQVLADTSASAELQGARHPAAERAGSTPGDSRPDPSLRAKSNVAFDVAVLAKGLFA
jgi:hypothetical protein